MPVPGTDRSIQMPFRRPELAITGQPEPFDLSGANLRALRIRHAQLENCVFDGADCRDAWISRSFVGCSFRKCNFSNAYLSLTRFHEQPDQYIRVDFSGSRFNRTMSGNAVFQDCLFRDVRMFRAEFEGLMLGCTFSGVLDDVQFGGVEIRRSLQLLENPSLGVHLGALRQRYMGEQGTPDLSGCDFSEAARDTSASRRSIWPTSSCRPTIM